MDEIAEFQGHVMDAFKLRARAGKRGYQRGSAEDGGWFSCYEKRFPSVNLQAIINFTGNSLPEENRKVALKSLHFERLGKETTGAGRRIDLRNISPVLLNECWNDLKDLADVGSGFDPEWEKTTGAI